MLKIFTTQLLGAFRQIEQDNEEALEDSARILAQVILSDGKVYLAGDSKMQGVIEEGTSGKNAMPNAEKWTGELENCPAGSVDAVLYCGNVFSNEAALKQLENLHSRDTSVVVITDGKVSSQDSPEAIDRVLSTGEQHPLVPKDNGEKIGHPGALSALYLYHALYLNVMDILDEY